LYNFLKNFAERDYNTIRKTVFSTARTITYTLVLLIFYALVIEPNVITLNRVAIRSNSLSRVLQGRVVVHISDLHIDTIGFRERKLVSVISELSPDLLFITGDLSAWDGKDFSGFLDFISHVKAKFGVFVILGDSDYKHRNKTCILCHIKNSNELKKRGNFRVLRNETLELRIGRESILLCALDPYSSYDSEDKKSELIRFTSPQTPIIILDHMFRGFESYSGKPELILSGNTHGGQVYLPSPIKSYILKRLEHNTKYLSGLFRSGKTFLYVNRGIGTSDLPIRFLCSPEVTVFRFIPENGMH